MIERWLITYGYQKVDPKDLFYSICHHHMVTLNFDRLFVIHRMIVKANVFKNLHLISRQNISNAFAFLLFFRNVLFSAPIARFFCRKT